METNTQDTTTIQRYYAGLMERMRDVVTLSQCNDKSELDEDFFDRMEVDADAISDQYPNDDAPEFADSMVYAIERLAVLEDNGTTGELRSVELLLGGGGPTITLTAEIRDDDVRDFTLWHSWGNAVGEEASMRSQSHEDRETVAAFLGVLGAFYV